MTSDSNVIEHLVGRIVDTVHPLRIVLFGSAARGDMGPDSDIDVMVVMPEGTHRRHTAQMLYRTLVGVPVPFDIVVATPSDLATHRDNVGLIYRSVLAEGRCVYGV